MKIKSFDRKTCRIVDDSIAIALKAVEEEYGISIKIGGGTFSGNSFTTKLEVSVIGVDGEVFDKKAEAYKLQAGLYGLREIPLGTEFISGGKRFKITGLNTRARKMPVIAECIAGGSGGYKFSPERIKMYVKGMAA